MRHPPGLRVLALACGLALGACSKEPRTPAGQVAARVNGGEISVHQVNALLAQGAPRIEGRAAAAQALERIIDQELLVQRALEEKLDRDPGVMAALESARRQVLAQAYLDRAPAAPAAADAAEVREFYAGNPSLFAKRRVYSLRELVVPAPGAELAALQAQVKRARSLDEVAAWLEARGVAHRAEVSTQPAEGVPLALLPALAGMKPGEIAFVASGSGGVVVQLAGLTEAPLTEAQAAPVIEKFLAGRRRAERVQEEVKKLRQQARIEYVGDFDTARAQPVPQAAPPSAALKKVGNSQDAISLGPAGPR